MKDYVEPVVLFPAPRPLKKAEYIAMLAKARKIVAEYNGQKN